MARASYGLSAPAYYSLRRLTQFPVTLISSRTTNLRNIRAVSISDDSTNWQPSLEVIGGAVDSSLPDVRFRRQCFRTRDYGTVSLDWISGDDRSFPSDSPVLILLPGLTGGSQDTYVRHMLLRARSIGCGGVVFNSRGCGDSPVTTTQSSIAILRVASSGSIYPKNGQCFKYRNFKQMESKRLGKQ